MTPEPEEEADRINLVGIVLPTFGREDQARKTVAELARVIKLNFKSAEVYFPVTMEYEEEDRIEPGKLGGGGATIG